MRQNLNPSPSNHLTPARLDSNCLSVKSSVRGVALKAAVLMAVLMGFAHSAHAAVVVTVSDTRPGETANTTPTTTDGSVSSDLSSFPTVTYTANGLDLTSVGGGSSETVEFNIVYTSNVRSPQVNGFGNISVTGGDDSNQVDPGEELTATVSLVSTTFTGTTDLGFTSITIGGRDSDEQFDITHEGGTINLPENNENTVTFAESSFVTLATVDTDKPNDAGNIQGFDVEMTFTPIPTPAALPAGLALFGLTLVRRRR